MRWVVDTCIIIDVLDADPQFGLESANLVDRYQCDGLVICPITFIELAPAFEGNMEQAKFFLKQINIDYLAEWNWIDTKNTFEAWNIYVEGKRNGSINKRPIADIQIGAFAKRFKGLITRNARDFSTVFPDLNIISNKPK
jgi:predicted nucleic acid-binding protein